MGEYTSSFEYGGWDIIQKISEKKKDERLLRRIHGVDLFAAEANVLFGSGSVHTAHGIMLQEILSDEAQVEEPLLTRERTGERTMSDINVDELPEVYMTVRKSPLMLINRETYDEAEPIFKESMKNNMFWMTLRIYFINMPGWAGYVSLTGEIPLRKTTIGCYPVIQHPITQYNTVYKCPKVAENASNDVGQKYVITTFDL